VTDIAYARERWFVASIGPSTRSEMHELGNLIVALHLCLRQLGGRQSTDELEGVVRTALEVSEQSMTAFRKVSAHTRNSRSGADRRGCHQGEEQGTARTTPPHSSPWLG